MIDEETVHGFINAYMDSVVVIAPMAPKEGASPTEVIIDLQNAAQVDHLKRLKMWSEPDESVARARAATLKAFLSNLMFRIMQDVLNFVNPPYIRLNANENCIFCGSCWPDHVPGCLIARWFRNQIFLRDGSGMRLLKAMGESIEMICSNNHRFVSSIIDKSNLVEDESSEANRKIWKPKCPECGEVQP